MKNFLLGFLVGGALIGGSVYGFFAYQKWDETIKAKANSRNAYTEIKNMVDKICPGALPPFESLPKSKN